MNSARKGCFKCGNCKFVCSLSFSCAGSVLTINMSPLVSIVGHHADSCTATERLCYNCRQPGHESAACPSPRSVSAKQCYSCGGVGHIQADCPTLRIQGMNAGGVQKCYVSLSLISSEGNTDEFNSTVVVLGTFLASVLLPLVVVHSVHASVLALPNQGRRPSSASAVAGLITIQRGDHCWGKIRFSLDSVRGMREPDRADR